MGRSRSRSRSHSPLAGGDGDIAGGARLHIGDLNPDVSRREIEHEFQRFGPIHEVWMARNPPCFAFVVFRHHEDAEEALREMDGVVLCGSRLRVSFARPRTRGRRRYSFDHDQRCYQCGGYGHFSRECDSYNRRSGGNYNSGYGRSRFRSYSRSPERRSGTSRRAQKRSRGLDDRSPSRTREGSVEARPSRRKHSSP